MKPNEISVVKHADYALTVEIDMWHKGELQCNMHVNNLNAIKLVQMTMCI